MARYHVNKDGNPGRCSAKVKCPFGDMQDEHYNSASEARVAYEQRAAASNLTSHSKEIDDSGDLKLPKNMKVFGKSYSTVDEALDGIKEEYSKLSYDTRDVHSGNFDDYMIGAAGGTFEDAKFIGSDITYRGGQLALVIESETSSPLCDREPDDYDVEDSDPYDPYASASRYYYGDPDVYESVYYLTEDEVKMHENVMRREVLEPSVETATKTALGQNSLPKWAALPAAYSDDSIIELSYEDLAEERKAENSVDAASKAITAAERARSRKVGQTRELERIHEDIEVLKSESEATTRQPVKRAFQAEIRRLEDEKISLERKLKKKIKTDDELRTNFEKAVERRKKIGSKLDEQRFQNFRKSLANHYPSPSKEKRQRMADEWIAKHPESYDPDWNPRY